MWNTSSKSHRTEWAHNVWIFNESHCASIRHIYYFRSRPDRSCSPTYITKPVEVSRKTGQIKRAHVCLYGSGKILSEMREFPFRSVGSPVPDLWKRTCWTVPWGKIDILIVFIVMEIIDTQALRVGELQNVVINNLRPVIPTPSQLLIWPLFNCNQSMNLKEYSEMLCIVLPIQWKIMLHGNSSSLSYEVLKY